MSRGKILAYLLSFLVLSGFLLGITFLFLVSVPLEELMVKTRFTQSQIDLIMKIVIFFLLILTGAATGWFYLHLLQNTAKQKQAGYLVAVMLVISVVIFGVLLTSDNAIIASVQGGTSSKSNYTFGPYPNEAKLKDLKDAGYDGVITLLNPAIPFEKVLLDQEKANGQKLGITIYSEPMLPWVSKNKTALEEIKQIVNSKQSKRFYFHCYLGKHRVDLVKQMLESTGLQPVAVTDDFIYPDHLERGELYYYQNGRIILGPYPVEEEWFNLISRGKVKKVISYLNPKDPEDVPWIERERKICQEVGVEFKLLPFANHEEGIQQFTELATFLARSTEKVYIHGFRIDTRSARLDGFLRSGIVAWRETQLPNKLKGGKLQEVNFNLVLGPSPSEQELQQLKVLGFTAVERVPLAQSQPAGVVANKLMEYLQGKKELFYIYGFSSDQEIADVSTILKHRFYGIEEATFPKTLAGQKPHLISSRLVIGSRPNSKELNQLALQGINTIVFLQGRDKTTIEQINKLQSVVEQAGLSFVVVEYQQDYTKAILQFLEKGDNSCYLIVPLPAQLQIGRDLEAKNLF